MTIRNSLNLPVRTAVRASPDYPYSKTAARVKLDQNESSEDFPAPLKAKVLEQLGAADWHRYDDLHADTVKQAIADYEAWPVAGIVATTGSNVLITLLIQLAALETGVVTPQPGFSLYDLDSRLLGVDVTQVPMNPDLTTNVDNIIAALPGVQPGIIFLANPHAPVGSMTSASDLERLAAASQGWLLVIDEAYHQYAQAHSEDLARRWPHIVLLRTFSKAWGLAGLRMGYALTSAELARNLQKLVPPFGTSVMQSITVQTALADPAYVVARVQRTIAERDRVYAALLEHPFWRVIPSHANFLLIRTRDAALAYQALLSAGVLVRRQDNIAGLEGCIRVTIGLPEENDAFLAAAFAMRGE